jgi:hypothetical protein
MATHEPIFSSRQVKIGSDRNFGLVFAVVFLIIGLAPPVLHDAPTRWWALAIAVTFGFTAFLAPRFLKPLNKLWFRFGLILQRVVNPVIMGLLYYAAVTPTGLILKARGKDVLGLKWEPEASTYWIVRERRGSLDSSMTQQYSEASLSFLFELWGFLRARKKFWIIPIVLMMLVFGTLLVLTQGSVVAPFVYTLF